VNHPKEQCCQNCLFWEGQPTAEVGECHRRAPTPRMISLVSTTPQGERYYGAVWPDTEFDEWCGEWAPAAVPQVYGTPKEG
jgi:hypothetical protein